MNGVLILPKDPWVMEPILRGFVLWDENMCGLLCFVSCFTLFLVLLSLYSRVEDYVITNADVSQIRGTRVVHVSRTYTYVLLKVFSRLCTNSREIAFVFLFFFSFIDLSTNVIRPLNLSQFSTVSYVLHVARLSFCFLHHLRFLIYVSYFFNSVLVFTLSLVTATNDSTTGFIRILLRPPSAAFVSKCILYIREVYVEI